MSRDGIFHLGYGKGGRASITYASQAWEKDVDIGTVLPTIRGFTPAVGGFSATVPAGMNAINANTGALTGAPSVQAYGQSFVVSVTDTRGVIHTATVSYSTAVAPDLSVPASPVTAEENIAVTPITVTNVGGTTSVVYSISAGSLPSGWSINPANGTVSGTHVGSVVASTTYTVLATGPTGLTDTVVVTYQVDAQEPILSYPDSPFDVAVSLTFDLAPTRGDSGTLAIDYDVTAGALPSYATLNASTGHITGTRTS